MCCLARFVVSLCASLYSLLFVFASFAVPFFAACFDYMFVYFVVPYFAFVLDFVCASLFVLVCVCLCLCLCAVR